MLHKKKNALILMIIAQYINIDTLRNGNKERGGENQNIEFP